MAREGVLLTTVHRLGLRFTCAYLLSQAFSFIENRARKVASA